MDAAQYLEENADVADLTWLNSLLDRNSGRGLGHDLVNFVQDMRLKTETGRKRLPTWPTNKTQARISRNTMGA
jgi:hypothetical protein